MALLRLGSTGPLLKNDTGLIDNSVTFAPGAVTTIAGSVTSSTIQFSWTAPGGQPPFTYTPQYKLHTDPTFISLATTTSLTATATGLVANAQYDVRTIATNPYGSSTNNTVDTTFTAPIGGAAPTAPSNLFLTMGQTVANVSFTVSTGTAPISYVVYDRVSGSSAQFATAAAGTTGSIAVSGLTPGVTYDFEVIATNQYGSATSQIVTGITNSGSIVQPGTVTLTANNVTTTTADITWTTPTGTAPFRYVLEYKTQAASLYTTLAQQTTIGASITGLLPNTPYDLRLSTTNNAGASSSTGSFTTAVAATPPGGVTITLQSATSSTVIVQWATPSGTTPFTYTPAYRVTNTGAYTAIATTSGLQATFSGLAAGVIYDFKVDVSGPGGNNTSNVLTTQTVPAGVAPSTVTITLGQTNDTSVSINWTMPTAGTLPFTYLPQFKLHSATQYVQSGSGTSQNLYTFQNLTPATQYDFTVYIQNSAGTTVNSTPVSQITTGGSAPSAVTVTLGAPLGYNYANLTWTAATGVGTITYTPQYRVVGTTQWQSVVPPTSALSTTVVGLAPLTNYQFQVLSVIGANSTASTNAPSGQTVAQPAVAGPITDIVFTQFQPVYSNMAFSDGAAAPVWGGFEPIGGIGPYYYEISAGAQYNPARYNMAGAYYAGHDKGLLTTPYEAGSLAFTGTQITDTLRLKITDAKGRSFEKDVSVNRLQAPSGPTLYPCGPYVFNNALRFDEIALHPSMIGSTVGTGTLSVTSDPTGIWGEFYTSIVPLNPPAAPAVNSYPLRLTSTSSEGTFSCNITAVITQATIGTVEFTPGTLSSAAPRGTSVGFCYCTTPGNKPLWSLSNDASGKYTINQTTGEVTVFGTLTATTDSITIVCTDHLTTSKTFQIPVGAGTILPATNMTFAASTTLDNAAQGQTIGTPSVTGIAGTKSWTLVDYTDYNANASPAGQLPPLAIDSVTGVVTQNVVSSAGPLMLAAQTYSVTIACTDRVNSCTQTFNFTVHPTATVTTYHVGRGMSTAHPGFGYEHWVTAMMLAANGHTDKKVFMIHADTDPEYYTNDWVDANFQRLYAPLRIEGVSLPDGTQARFGGPSSGVLDSFGHPRYGQRGPFTLGPGDIEIVNMEFSGLHNQGDITHSYEALYKEGSTGNLLIQNCVFRDVDIALHSAPTHCKITVDHCEFTNAYSAAHIGGSGPAHALYIDSVGSVLFTHNLIRQGNYGHLFKCRAKKSEIAFNRIFETPSSSAGHVVNFPNAGDHWLHDNVLVKGPSYTNQDLLRYGEDPWTYITNNLLVENNTIVMLSQIGATHYGTPVAIGWFVGSNILGELATSTVRNNAFYYTAGTGILDQGGGRHLTNAVLYGAASNVYDSAPQYSPTLSGNTTLTIPPAIDLTRPFLSGSLPPIHNTWVRSNWGDDSYLTNFSQAVQLPDQNQLRVAHTATVGTVICNITVSTDAYDLTVGTQQFGPGNTWIIDQTNTMYYTDMNPNPWAPAGRYSITANSDGSATLKVAGTMPGGPAVDFIQVKVTGTGDGSLTKVNSQRYAIVVT